MTARHRAFLFLLACAPAAAQEAPPGPSQPRSHDLASALIEAERTGDETLRRDIAANGKNARDPFLVVDALLSRYVQARAAGGDGASALAAAASLARAAADLRPALPGLPDLVRAWGAFSREELAAHDAFRQRAHRVKEKMRTEPTAEAFAVAREMLAAPPQHEVFSVLLAWETGEALQRAWRIDEAEVVYAQCADLAIAMGWKTIGAHALYFAGDLARAQGCFARALPRMTACLHIYESCGDRSGNTARMRLNVAALHRRLGERAPCEVLLAAARDEARLNGDRELEAYASAEQGDLLLAAGRPAAALEQFAAALALTPNPENLATHRRGHALASVQLGRLGDALDALELALAEHESLRARDEIAQDLLALADVNTQLARVDIARDMLQRAVAVAVESRDLATLAAANARLLRLDLDAGRAPSVAPLRAVLATMRELGAADAALTVRRLVAEGLLAAGDTRAALADLRALAADVDAGGDAAHALLVQLVLAEALLKSGDAEAAGSAFGAARERAEAVGDRAAAAQALAGAAGAALLGGDAERATALAHDAVLRFRDLGQGLGERSGSGLRDVARRAADVGARALVQRQRAAPALDVAGEALFFVESARAMLLGEELEHRAALREARLPAELVAREAFARRRAGAAQQELLLATSAKPVDAERVRAARAQIDAAYAELEAAVAQLERKARADTAVAFPAPIDAAALCASLPGGTALVEYHVAGDALIALVARADGLRLVALGASGAIAARAGAWRELLASGDGAAEAAERDAAAALYDALLRPLEGALGDAWSLWIAPDGALAFVPFEALLRRADGGERRAVEERAISYLPSATVGTLLRDEAQRRPRGAGFVALGDPIYPAERAAADASAAAGSIPRDARLRGFETLDRLPGSADEVQALAALFPTTLAPEQRCVLLRGDATLEALRQALAAAPARLSVLHLACHGFVHPRWPQLGGLVLGGGEVLTIGELARSALPADLAVLSACDTAAGEVRAGEGVLGLVRAGFLAGCPRLLVSQWRIDDRATSALMQRMYGHLVRDGLAPGAALRRAQLDCLAAGGAAARPSQWAAFVLWGVAD